MGGLSRKRTIPRVVKKTRKPADNLKKKINVYTLPTNLKNNWDNKKSVNQNFKTLGLQVSTQPSMRHSKKGHKLLDEAKEKLNYKYYQSNQPLKESDSESDESEIDEQQKVENLQKLFPNIKPESESIIEKTPKKVKHDEIKICEKLVKKYEDQYGKMSRDIKINYLQWSKGQCKAKIAAYKTRSAR